MEDCEHRPVWVGQIAVTACAHCGTVDWFSTTGPVDPAEAMAALFGNYELVGTLDALGAPSPEVLVYRPPSARRRAGMAAFPQKTWLKTGPHLWMSHDGQVLLLAPTKRIMFDNLMRGA
jgi:hypothetical protein